MQQQATNKKEDSFLFSSGSTMDFHFLSFNVDMQMEIQSM